MPIILMNLKNQSHYKKIEGLEHIDKVIDIIKKPR
jgi:excinuclease UvrABC ATPase subunit